MESDVTSPARPAHVTFHDGGVSSREPIAARAASFRRGRKMMSILRAPDGSLCRRGFFTTAVGALAFARAAVSSAQVGTPSRALTKEERDRMTPEQVVTELKKGNERFRAGKPLPHDYVAQQGSSASGQYPAAVVLGCLDSRAPAEIVL